MEVSSAEGVVEALAGAEGRPQFARRAFGLAARLAAATSLLIIGVSSWQSWVLARHDLAHVRDYLGDRGRTLATRLASDSTRSLASGDLDTLERLAEQTRTASGVVYVRILDRQGLLLAAAGQRPLTTAAAGASAGGPAGTDVWNFDASIAPDEPRASRAALGSVSVGLSLEPLYALQRRQLASGLAFTVLSTLIGILGATLIARALTGPLRALSVAVDRISRGDFEARVTVGRNDEIGRLGASFNAMAASLARTRATLDEQLRELERANHLKSEFLATVSHELRTPLNVIIGYTEMLAAGDPSPVTKEQAEILDSIQRYAREQLDLITSVLDFTRLGSGKVSLKVERFALEPMLLELQAVHSARLRDSDVVLTVTVDPAAAELETDRVKLQEILRNLVDNAVKFTEKGWIEVRARSAEPGSVAIEVTDSGSGIAPDELEAIFDAFHQVGASSTRCTGGVGLGLSIVRQLADALGGRVSVTSRLGEGSCFRVEIPGGVGHAGTEPRPDATTALDAAARNTARLAGKAHPPRSVSGAAPPTHLLRGTRAPSTRR